MGKTYSLDKIAKYMDEEDNKLLKKHSLVFNSIVFHNVAKSRYYCFRFEVKLHTGMIMVDKFIASSQDNEWLYDKSGILELLKLYNGYYKYDNIFDIKYLNEGFYKFIYLFVKDKLFLNLLLACKKKTYNQYIISLNNEEGESIDNYQRRTLKDIVGELYH